MLFDTAVHSIRRDQYSFKTVTVLYLQNASSYKHMCCAHIRMLASE